MHAIGVGCYAGYIDYLANHPGEFQQLFNAILINVTSFFRDPGTFEFIRTSLIPSLLESKRRDEPVRIWVAGCASGEECYTTAMLFAEALGPHEYRDRVTIYATDVDDEGLALARQAAYSDRRVEAVPPALRRKYFDRAAGRWIFRQDFRRGVVVGRHDLLDDPPISQVDLLMCRNTLMYFHHEAQARIVSRFRHALRDGGYLILGRAEMLLDGAGGFAPANLKHRVFVKVHGQHGSPRWTRPVSADVSQPADGRLREISFDQDPTAQFVVDQEGRLLLVNARACDLLGLLPDDIGRPLQDLTLPCRPAELRACVDEAAVRQHVVQREVAWPTAAGETRYFIVQVMPVTDDGSGALATRLIFTDVTRQHELQEELERSRQELEIAYEELQAANDELRSANAELEATNEELQSTVEELEATNEELQSANEELEIMNAELESANEALETINHELRMHGGHMTRADLLLGAVLRYVPMGVVVLDSDLRVELCNEAAACMWGVCPQGIRGAHVFDLETGLPIDRLRGSLLALAAGTEASCQVTVAGTTRNGQPMAVRLRASVVEPQAPTGGRGIVMLMENAAVSG